MNKKFDAMRIDIKYSETDDCWVMDLRGILRECDEWKPMTWRGKCTYNQASAMDLHPELLLKAVERMAMEFMPEIADESLKHVPESLKPA